MSKDLKSVGCQKGSVGQFLWEAKNLPDWRTKITPCRGHFEDESTVWQRGVCDVSGITSNSTISATSQNSLSGLPKQKSRHISWRRWSDVVDPFDVLAWLVMSKIKEADVSKSAHLMINDPLFNGSYFYQYLMIICLFTYVIVYISLFV
jgi:hypothetical protein